MTLIRARLETAGSSSYNPVDSAAVPPAMYPVGSDEAFAADYPDSDNQASAPMFNSFSFWFGVLFGSSNLFSRRFNMVKHNTKLR